jgi:hypothetical protein
MENLVPIKKADEMLQVVYGEVYTPYVLDSDKDFMTEEAVMRMAHLFMILGLNDKVDREHDNVLTGSYVVESWVAREGDPDFLQGAWVVGIKLDDESWAEYLKGEINGFSFQAINEHIKTHLVMYMPEYIVGDTSVDDGHMHKFKVFFDEDGNYMGGSTDYHTDENGVKHRHLIRRGTKTEDAEGHGHVFVFVDTLLEAQKDANQGE